jgi:hypothetical protein
VLEAAGHVPERACRFFVDGACLPAGGFIRLHAERATPSGSGGPASGTASGFIWLHDAAA